ncbi:MAG: hypothetical protein ABR599_04805 [Gemmatimonadota bacterium]
MAGEDVLKKLWPDGTPPTSGGPYEYKGVRFKLRSSGPRATGGWSFQPYGHETQVFASWEEAGPAIEEACTAIQRHRVKRRDNL